MLSQGMTKMKIALVEDDPYISTTINWKIKGLGEIKNAPCYTSAAMIIKNEKPDLAIVDLHLGAEFEAGKKLIALCKSQNIPTIAMSSDERSELIQELYQLGATHFLIKKDYLDLLYHYANILLKTHKKEYFDDIFQKKFITQNIVLQNHLKNLWSIPLKGESLHISGPTGSGKTLLAEIFHQELFQGAPFIHLNCAEIPETLLESELFGHVKGAFTNADKEYKGKLQLAHNGTLFLDEIGSLSLTLQAKLLKVLETKCFYPVGSNEKIRVNFTLITATWEDLFERAKNNTFRLDLLQRIMGYRIHLPSLKDRPSDLEFYMDQWIKNYPRKFRITKEAKNLMMRHDFSGNFRELKAILLQLAQTPQGDVQTSHIENLICSDLAITHNHPTNNMPYNIQDVIQDGIKKYLHKIERQIVADSLDRNNQNVTAVLTELKLSPSSFYRIAQEK